MKKKQNLKLEISKIFKTNKFSSNEIENENKKVIIDCANKIIDADDSDIAVLGNCKDIYCVYKKREEDISIKTINTINLNNNKNNNIFFQNQLNFIKNFLTHIKEIKVEIDQKYYDFYNFNKNQFEDKFNKMKLRKPISNKNKEIIIKTNIDLLPKYYYENDIQIKKMKKIKNDYQFWEKLIKQFLVNMISTNFEDYCFKKFFEKNFFCVVDILNNK